MPKWLQTGMIVTAFSWPAPGQITSVYTPLSGPSCEIIKQDAETGSTVHACPGVGGIKVQVAFDDGRMSITLISRTGESWPLDFWNLVTRSFSSIGEQAEWRMNRRSGKGEPVALIVRVHEPSQVRAKARSYLTVTKVTHREACIVNIIPASPEANRRARQSADLSQDQACLTARRD